MNFWNPFRRKSFLNAEDEDWHLKTWLWMLKHFGGTARLKKSPIVTPTADYFPPTQAEGEKRAAYVFDCVKKHAGLGDLTCELIAQPGESKVVGELVTGRELRERVRGSFRMADGKVTIAYDPAENREPFALVSTFAHELAHYPLANAGEAPPGGSEMAEFATDLMTVFLGFGVFGADCAFNFWQGRGGGRTGGPWGWSTAGYLRESDWVYALAVFLSLRGQAEPILKNWLKPSLYSDLKVAARVLASNPARLEEHRRF